MHTHDIIVIGGSSGATGPLKTILRALPADLEAAVMITIHIPARSIGILATVASAEGRLPVATAIDGMTIEPGRVYLAAPDHHLIVRNGRVRLGKGPRENMVRPAIDPLFRSAAIAFGPRVVGVLLSGLLSDGVAGLDAIRRCGGITIVQDPDDAIADEMPRNALAEVPIDMALSALRIGDVLVDLARQPAGPVHPAPPDLQLEVDIAAGERIDPAAFARFSEPVPITCPQCGGVLSQMTHSAPLRFRCQVGHALTPDLLAKEQEGAVDEALRVALRIIEERAELVTRMARDASSAGRGTIAELYFDRAVEYRDYAETIRRAVLLSLPKPQPDPSEDTIG